LATVNKLLRDLASFENDLKAGLTADTDINAAIRAGYTGAIIAAQQRILELSVKGLIPEGKGGRIMSEIQQAIETSRDRATHAGARP
jgi:hypothetical protein